MGELAWETMLGRRLEAFATNNAVDMVNKFVAAGASKSNALHSAVSAGRDEVARILLEAGADATAVSSAGNTPLTTAAARGRRSIVRLLLQQGVRVDSRDRAGLTALYRSPRYKHRGVLDDLLGAGADPNARCGPLGRTPLHSAYRNPWAMMTLRAAGAAVDAEDRHKERPLHLAATSCHKCVSLLCAYGASVDAAMDGGLTPLHRAAASFQPRAVAKLIERGADVDARTDSGETPLHLAVRSRAKGLSCYSLSLEILEALLRAGANEDLLDEDGRRPVDVVGADAGEAGLYEFDAAQFERMRARLLSAPADRAWRRRGYLVMLRVGPRGLSTRSGRGAARVGRELSARKRRKSSGWVEGLGWLVSETNGAPIEVFRTIVSYL